MLPLGWLLSAGAGGNDLPPVQDNTDTGPVLPVWGRSVRVFETRERSATAYPGTERDDTDPMLDTRPEF